ncbi:MAG TPA: DSD1 family PLP-dependent enzyme [Sphingomicrobium sp.]|nr:DSD1 family PLP-dependent enzyme [Sphingomicrobium sp.]
MIGMPVDDIPTPALVVDLDALDLNIERLGLLLAQTGVRSRPHAKAHKCVEIARRQIAQGAIGICCQTVAEVEAFAAAGIVDILLTNEVTDPRKLARLAAISDDTRLGICVDSMMALELIAQARPRRVWDIYIEVDVGGARCGLKDPIAAVALAREVSRLGLNFAGLQAYNGKIQHLRNAAERKRATANTAAATRVFVQAFERAGLVPGVISGGGTGTVVFDCANGVLGEVQCGTYALMDADYRSLQSTPGPKFALALTVLASVIAVASDHVVIDAGLKALAFDSGMPAPRDLDQIAYGNPSDEHGILTAVQGASLPLLGERVHLIPGHCDPTVALHERLYAVRRGMVEEVWRPLARGVW